MKKLIVKTSHFLSKIQPLIWYAIILYIILALVGFQKDLARKAEENQAISRDIKKVLCENVDLEDCNLEKAVRRLEEKIDKSARLTNCLLLAHGQLINGGLISERDKKNCQAIVDSSMGQIGSSTTPTNTQNKSQKPKTKTQSKSGGGNNGNNNNNPPEPPSQGLIPNNIPVLGPLL